MKLLTAAAILAANDLPTVDVDCSPEWPGSVRLRCMSAGERTAFYLDAPDDDERLTAENSLVVRLVAQCAVDEDGARLFADEEALRALASKNPKPLEKLFRAALDLNRMSKRSGEELEKNLEAAPISATSTTSPSD